MSRQEFINRLIAELTEGGSIAASPNRSRIESVIEDSKSWFYEHSDDAMEQQYMIIDKKLFKTELFKLKRQIQLPEIVHAVIMCRTMGQNWRYTNINPDYKYLNSINYATAATGDSRSLLTGITMSHYNSYLNKFTVRDITYSFNNYTRMLTIEGRDIYDDVVLDVSVLVPEESLFANDFFFRYTLGKAKISFANTIEFMDQKLIGGYKINASAIRTQGEKLIEDVKKYIQESRVGDFLSFWD